MFSLLLKHIFPSIFDGNSNVCGSIPIYNWHHRNWNGSPIIVFSLMSLRQLEFSFFFHVLSFGAYNKLSQEIMKPSHGQITFEKSEMRQTKISRKKTKTGIEINMFSPLNCHLFEPINSTCAFIFAAL